MAGGGPGMRRIAAVLLVLLAVPGCAVQPSHAAAASQTPSPPPSASTPIGAPLSAAEATASAYYTAIGAHDADAARAYLASEYFKGFATPAAYRAWIANYLNLTGLTIHSERPASADTAAQHPGYLDLTEVLVSYHAVLRAPSANESTGSMDRFVIVGRTSPAAPWLIVDITTGP